MMGSPFAVRLAILLAVWVAAGSSLAAVAQETTPEGATPAKVAAKLDLAEVQKRIYDPTRVGLADLSFFFEHPAFTGSVSYSKMSFRCVFKAPDQIKILVVNPAPAFAAMEDQFARILDYVWRFGGPQAVLREKLDQAEAEAQGVAVRVAAADARKGWVLHFRESGGRLLLDRATSPEYGSVQLEYADVGPIHLVSRLTIDDPKRPIGNFTIEFRDVKANSGLDAAVFKPAH